MNCKERDEKYIAFLHKKYKTDMGFNRMMRLGVNAKGEKWNPTPQLYGVKKDEH